MTVTRFDPERHLYYVGDPEELVPSATRMIAALGLVETAHFTKEARDRGTHVHLAVHYYLLQDLDEATIYPPWKGHVDAAIRFIEDSGADRRNLLTEVRVHNAELGYCGTADVLGELFRSEAVADWKSGAIGEATGIQTALYDLAKPLANGRRRRRLGVQLRADGKYRLVDIDREQDPSGLDYHRARAVADLYRRFHWKREKAEIERYAA